MSPPRRSHGERRRAQPAGATGNPPPRRAPAGGVALIEVLIALLVVSFGLLGLVGLQTRAHQYAASAEDTNRAALLANDIASVMWVSQSASVPSADYSAWQARVVAAGVDGLPNGSGTVTTAGNIATITLSWKPPRAAAAAASSRFVTQVLIP